MKRSIILAAASLMVMGCSKRVISPDAPVGPVADPNVVQFSIPSVTVSSKLNLDGTQFTETTDMIGLFAVIPGFRLGATSSHPLTESYHYKNKIYQSGAWLASVPAALAYDHNPFTPFGADASAQALNTIYYQTGDKGWDFYAYYPSKLDINQVSGPTTGGGTHLALPANSSAVVDINSFTNQTADFTTPIRVPASYIIVTDTTTAAGAVSVTPVDIEDAKGFPMLATYNNKVNKKTEPATPVKLEFGYVNAKMTLNINLDRAVGRVDDIIAIEFYSQATAETPGVDGGTGEPGGLTSGFVFDLAHTGIAPAVNPLAVGFADMVVSQRPYTGGASAANAGIRLNGELITANETVLIDRPSYKFQNLWGTVGADFQQYSVADGFTYKSAILDDPKETTFTPHVYKTRAIGYLIPTASAKMLTDDTDHITLLNPRIRITVGNNVDGNTEDVAYNMTVGAASNKVYTAELNTDATFAGSYLPNILPGMHYLFTLNVTQSGVTFVATIIPWTVVDGPTGGIPAQ